MSDISLQSATEIAITDTTLIPAQPTGGVWSKITGLGIKTFLSNTFSKYLGDADFYQYSIVRTVASGNLTVALKNYEGNDPTPTKPVKIMIGGVVRTITGALGFTKNSGINYLNLGSAELATKEADIFVYLIYDLTDSIVKILGGRIPYATTLSDFNYAVTPEKGILEDDGITNNGASPVVNIGRFNATLSAGGAYTWSIPGNSVIINRPIYESSWKEIVPQLSWTAGTPPTGVGIAKYFYKIIGNMVVVNYFAANYSGPGINVTRLAATLPFSLSAGIGFSSINSSLNVSGIPNDTTAYIGTASASNVEIKCNSVGADRWSVDGTYFI